MANQKFLTKAPISEALIDFRVKTRADLEAGAFFNLKGELESRYPSVAEQRLFQGILGIKAGEGPFASTEEKGINGYLFSTADRRTLAQFRIDGFTFNRLRPYTSWEMIFPEAMNLWETYVRVAKPELVTRLAVRYINSLELPLPFTGFSRYLTAPPTVPVEIPQAVSSFLTRVVVHDPETGIAASIIQALGGIQEPNCATIILDVDVYRSAQFEIDAPEIQSTIGKLRDFKNKIFFSSITEEAVGLFE